MAAPRPQAGGPAGGGFAELRLDAVSRRFAGVLALDRLSLAIRRGEFIALLGPSGCGKSTALNCIAGLLRLTSGSIWLDERRIDGLPPEARGFGMIFQNYALFPHMTARKNIGFGLAMRRLPKAEIRRRVDAVLALVKLEAHADKLPGQLSGGQQQRVAIARAIVVEPPVVLMDEPLSNLDAKLRIEMRSEIKRIHQELGRATIYVTHDQEEALSLADRIVVLMDGATQQIGTPEELYARPANLGVALFMGYRNTLDVRVERKEGDRVFVRADGLGLVGLRRGELRSGEAVAAIRPDDLVPGDGPNAIEGRAETVEYCGRDYLIDFVTAAGMHLHARSAARVEPGEALSCYIAPERVLVFARG
ncbi:MAG TPA: ABC transporter ATP-binding protein [Alphaproteobacteria bacterium]|nr:ABC transporter ATP-binding protein [Alphaproteobacteria bacterium]